MLVITDPRCALHAPEHEVLSGNLVSSASLAGRPPFPTTTLTRVHIGRYLESPDRLRRIEGWLRNHNTDHAEAGRGFDFEEAADDFRLDPILAVHSQEYVSYLQTAYEEWTREGGSKVGNPFTFIFVPR